MNRRRRRGATLGLVAVCVLVIIVVGVGCFFLAKIFGGGREVANATDAGVLNLAKSTMRNGDLMVGVQPAAGSDFALCAQPPAAGGTATINLLTYNRCVAQTLLVAVNAKNEGTGQATTNAQGVITQLMALGTQLNTLLQNAPQMENYFNAVKNDTRMWGNTGVNPSSYATSWMKPGSSTNVWFTTNELAALSFFPANADTTGTVNLAPPTGPAGTGSADGHYMEGYVSLAVPGITDGAHQIFGVPVFPQQNPHLVAGKDFTASPQPAASVPPNSFQIQSASQDAKSGTFGGAVAAAIVGAVKTAAGGQNYQFPAAIPGGYVALTNLPGHTLPAGYQGFDNSDNIFNNELYLGPGIDVASVGGGSSPPNPSVFSNTDMTGIAAWAAFNTSGPGTPGYTADTLYGPNPLNGNKVRNANLDPSAAHPAGNFYVAATPGNAGVPATTADMLKVMGGDINCLNQLNANGQLSDSCQSWLATFQQTFHPGPSGNSPAVNNPVYSSLDILKGQVISDFQHGVQNTGNIDANAVNAGGVMTPTGPAYGLGVLVNGFNPTPTPQYGCPIMQGTGPTCTINALLGQVDGQGASSPTCAQQQIVNQITQRCYEIKPDATPTAVAGLFNQQLPMNTTLYIYLPNGDPTQQLTISATAPTTVVAGTQPDGAGSATYLDCHNDYPLVTTLVDTEISSFGRGDDNLHDMPYRTIQGTPFMAQDHAQWTPSSGAANMLGQLQFSNQTSGDETFSRPN